MGPSLHIKSRLCQRRVPFAGENVSIYRKANNRYYYRNKQTNRIQWEYPLVEDGSKGDRTASSREESGAKVADAVSEEQHKSRSSGSSRHRKRDEKDRGKYDKRSSSHRYRRKRRRRRDHSTSSNSSEGSQQHRHHHKSKKKKRHRSERSPSVEIMEDIDGMDMDDVEITGASMTQPVSSSQPASNATSPPSATSTIEVTGDGAPPPPSTAPGLTEECTSTEDTSRQVEEEQEEEEEGSKEEESLESASTVVISKPPQIVVPPQIAAAINPSELHSGAELYSASHISATSLPKSSTSQADKALLSSETASETIEGQSGDGDKQSKKKKKDKKPLAAGSSSMMKKKHLSSMVQKWQNVKKEVEKEDRAKELRQAAIRKKIEELK